MTIYFTSDTHFCHKNIIKHSKRPFKDIPHMHEELIRRWNEIVTPDDEVYHLGDMGIGKAHDIIEVFEQLAGIKYLVVGNHDRGLLRTGAMQYQFVWMKSYYEISIEDPDAHRGRQRLILMHYPLVTWNGAHKGSWHLHGHCHGNLNEFTGDNTRIDVGVDNWNFAPVSYSEIKKVMQTRKYHTVDHHGTR